MLLKSNSNFIPCAAPVDCLQSIKKALAEIFGKLTMTEREVPRGHHAKRNDSCLGELRPRLNSTAEFSNNAPTKGYACPDVCAISCRHGR